MNGMTTIRMLMATAALAAVAALFASPANSMIPRTPDEPGRFPYLGDGHLLAWGQAQAGTGQQIQSYLDRQLDPNLRKGAGGNERRFAVTESRAGSTRYGYVVGGELVVPGHTSGQLSSGFDGATDSDVVYVNVGVGFP